MDEIERQIQLSAFQVQWSPPDAAFVARSSQYPGVICADEGSSLAAVDGLIETIRHRVMAG
ncbi:MAG: hypothetical protein JWN03_6433 [Nocardia sp.]|uniref:hypothetical protein n=1 Tax=Nocardia sp. TaxID=1821 RepID=UPI0026135169|nr:hypothetical protein [Nocardia sp.]MCU1646158.1 hypothetical protein [Nocardia sp.]